MGFIQGIPSITTNWTNGAATTSNGWVNQTQLEVFDRLVDIDGNYIIDIDGNYISLGGGIPSSTAATGTTWTNPASISTVWNVGA